MTRVMWLFATVMSLFATPACSGSHPTSPIPDAAVEPVVETPYLAFQVFEGTADPAMPWDTVVDYTPAGKVAATIADIVTTIGTTGSDRGRLAIMLGPISLDHSDAEARQIIDDGFAAAVANDVAIGFHLDDSMFWSKRTDLADPANLEWTDWSGTPATGLLLNWSHPPARLCFNAPAIRAEVTRRARDVIGAEIVEQLHLLEASGKANLFAGVIAGWESHMGQDVATVDRVGFHALANRGFSAASPPSDINTEVASIVAEFISSWASGLVEAGIDPSRVYTHIAFLSKVQFAELQASDPDFPPGVTYDDVVDAASSSQRPSVAFITGARPGFTTYPADGVFDQIGDERASHGAPPWASAEGTNLLPGDAPGTTGMTMDQYLAGSFDHGATLVTIYGWGIGGPSASQTNPFQVVAQGAESITAYRAFLQR